MEGTRHQVISGLHVDYHRDPSPPFRLATGNSLETAGLLSWIGEEPLVSHVFITCHTGVHDLEPGVLQKVLTVVLISPWAQVAFACAGKGSPGNATQLQEDQWTYRVG